MLVLDRNIDKKKFKQYIFIGYNEETTSLLPKS